MARLNIERLTGGRPPRHHQPLPRPALAQEAEMSLSEYEDFVYGACRVDEPDPVAAWREQGATQQRIVDWLAGKEQMHLEGPGD